MIGDQVRYLVLRPETPISYLPGQFVMLRLKNADGNLVVLSFSLANWDDSGQLEFVIRIDPKGQMTPLIDELQAGEQIDVKGPFGHFGAEMDDRCNKVVFIAGGVGISPLRGLALKAFADKSSFPMQLFYGFRSGSDYLFQSELEQLATDERLELYPAISEEDPAWEGATGYIHENLDGKIFKAAEGVHCFICGPPLMVKATRNQLLEMGFERSAIHVEAW